MQSNPSTLLMKDFIDGFLERQDAAHERIAAQAAAQAEKMTAQTQQIQQFNQQFIQMLQAAGHGERWLGLAKGDG